MTSAQIAACDRLAALLAYPIDDSYIARITVSAAELGAVGFSSASVGAAALKDAVAQWPLEALQEEYSAALDFDPDAALELGWHLFGDGPARGPWLAALAEALARADVPRTSELPDHLACILMLVAREDPEQASALAELVSPAAQKIHQRLVERGSPFGALVAAARSLLDAVEKP